MLDKGNLLKMKTTKRKTIKLMTKTVKESQDDLQKHISLIEHWDLSPF